MGKELKRMRYFDGLLLDAKDYTLDQEYQRRLLQLHNRYLHTWGIVTGLEVEPVQGDPLKVIVLEGLALNQVDVERKNENSNQSFNESISQEIYICDDHPDRIIDLSKYKAGENIYISVSYKEVSEDRDDFDKGRGQEIHIAERGCISHSKEKPFDIKKDIILARIVPKVRLDNSEETYIDKSCIYNIDSDNTTELRKYAGPEGQLTLEKVVFSPSYASGKKPHIRAMDMENSSIGLEVEAYMTNFIGDVNIKGNLTVEGNFKVSSENGRQNEVLISNNFIQVNSPAKGVEWKLQDGGLEVYRGDTEEYPDARIAWSEANKRWQAKIDNTMWDIAYGPIWERLIKGGAADDLHRHSRISTPDGRCALEVDSSGNLSMNVDLALTDKTLWFRSANDTNHGIGWFGAGKPFAGINVDGPVLFGLNGGILGTANGGQKPVLSWNSSCNVGIGVDAPKNDRLEVGGSVRILSSTNPVRFTSSCTPFPDLPTNQAEICNDTTYHKALMIVGNKSAGQTRKVSIWDRLDVNGFLYVNGSMQVSQALTPSAGNGNNGIIFPSDPGGGLWDGAWIKYYPRTGEACTLEIGTSNDRDDNISLMASGNVGIGTTAPADKLDVSGWVRLLSDTNPLRFTSAWSPYNENDQKADKYAEICNDTSKYKSLIIIGNRSDKSISERKVSIWDRLEVNGSLQVTGNFQPVNAIIPSVGYGEDKGIMFPKDPGGGSGDAAWIRYYSDTRRGGGENMTLEIGISNDWGGGGYWSSGDHMRLYASGGVYVDGYFYYSSSREYKENISALPTQKAKQILEGLNPVTFNFKGDTAKTTMGFIAEEVPQEVADLNQKAISPMEIITVLTSVIKDHKKAIAKLQKQLEMKQS